MPTTPQLQEPPQLQDSLQQKECLQPQDSSCLQDGPRSGDRAEASIPQRSERVFSDQYLWYFHTREGSDIGPFRYRSEAENNLAQFMVNLDAKSPDKRADKLK